MYHAIGALAVASGFIATGGHAPVIRTSTGSPEVGLPVTIAVAPVTRPCGQLVARALARPVHRVQLSFRRDACRGSLIFRESGRWILRYGTARKVLAVRRAVPTPHPEGARLGRSGCAPPSPITQGRLGQPEVFGTTYRGRLWALFFNGTRADPSSAVFNGIVGSEVKVVFRFNGVFIPAAIAPDGTRRAPLWVRAHSGSDWTRPGAEYGSGWAIDQPGCWEIRVGSGRVHGSLWFVAHS